MTTIDDVAKWMKDTVDSVGMLDQGAAVYQIRSLFGADFVYTNENGNLAINKSVLRKFNKITEADVIWSRGERVWKKRQPYHKPGRQQD